MQNLISEIRKELAIAENQLLTNETLITQIWELAGKGGSIGTEVVQATFTAKNVSQQKVTALKAILERVLSLN